MNFKNRLLVLLLAGIAAANPSFATTIVIDFNWPVNGTEIVGVASLEAIDNGGGIFTATSGALNVTSGPDYLVHAWNLSAGAAGIDSGDNWISIPGDPHLSGAGLLGTFGGDFLRLSGAGVAGRYTLTLYNASGTQTQTWESVEDAILVNAPEAGATVAMIGMGLTALGLIRRKVS